MPSPRLTKAEIQSLIDSLYYALDRVRNSTSFANYQQRNTAIDSLVSLQNKLRVMRDARKDKGHGRPLPVH